jgi:RNA-binding protein
VVAEIDRALTAHELIKIRAGGSDRESRTALLETIGARTAATPVHSVGKVLVLWRPRPEAEVRS